MRRPDAVLLALALAATLSAARADEPTAQQKLEAVERDIAAGRRESEALTGQAAALQAELARLQAESVKAAAAAQDNEHALSTGEHALEQLQRDEATQRASLGRGRAQETQILAALARLAAVPPTALAFAPGSPVDLARGGMLMSAAVPRLEAEARDLAGAVDQLNRMQAAIGAQQTSLAERQAALDAARQKIAQLVRQRQALAGATSEKARAAQHRVEALVAEAGDLRQAVERIEKEREDRLKEAARPAGEQAAAVAIPAPAGPGPRLIAPVAGDIVKPFGAAEAYGRSKGLSLEGRPGAQIVAPCSGEIMFAGPFRGYGQILIIDHGGGYHLLMAGIGRIQGTVGQRVVAGEPVGTMATEATPTLYLELRRDGQPVDPQPWLAAHDGKASG